MHMICFYTFTHKHDLSSQSLLKFVPVMSKVMMLCCSSMTTNIVGVFRVEQARGILFIKARSLSKKVCVEILQHPFMLIGQMKTSVSISTQEPQAIQMYYPALGVMLAPRLVLDSVHGFIRVKICPGLALQMKKGIIAPNLGGLLLPDPISGQTFKTLRIVSVKILVVLPTAKRMET